jgi:hypothetical protein
VVTDTSRREVRRYYTLRENTGATESADRTPSSGLATDIRAEELTGARLRDQSVAVLEGARSIDASGYGNLVSLLPEDRPANAFDGDPRTAWRIDVPSFRSLRGDEPSTLRIDLGRRVGADHVDVVQASGPGAQPISSFEVVLDGTRVIPVTVDPAAAFDPAGTRVDLDGKPFSTLEVRIPDADFAGPVGIAEVAIPGVSVEEIIRLPRSLEALGRVDRPLRLAYVLTRLRVDPGDQSRTDPELALHRAFTVPTPMAFTLSGSARLNGRAADAVLDDVTGAVAPSVHVSATDRLLGDPASRASAAVDDDLATAWQTPLDAVVGQRWTARVDDGFRLPSLALDVVTDEHHSLPTRLAITVDGSTQVFDVPPLTASSEPGTTSRVVFSPARPLEGKELSIEVLATAPRAAADLKGATVTLPVALAEVGVAVPEPAASTAATTTPCRDDLLTIDGAAIPVTVGAPAGSGVRDPRPVTACDGAPITLTAGRHVLRTAPGLTTGIDLDQLALVSPRYADAPTNADVADAPEVVRSDPHSAVVKGAGTPYWVRLNQSSNRGWEATAHWRGDSQDLGPAHTVDAFASGWSVNRGTDARLTYQFSWKPQRAVDVALAISGLAALLCLGLVALRPRRRARTETETPRLAADPFSARRPPIALSAVVVVVGAAFAGPAVGAALLLLAVGASFARRARWLAVAVRLAPLAAMGAAVAFVVAKQVRNDYPHVMEWPTFFPLAHSLAFFGLLGFALLAWADRSEDLGPDLAHTRDPADTPAGGGVPDESTGPRP